MNPFDAYIIDKLPQRKTGIVKAIFPKAVAKLDYRDFRRRVP